MSGRVIDTVDVDKFLTALESRQNLPSKCKGSKPENVLLNNITLKDIRQKIDELHTKRVTIRDEAEADTSNSNVDYFKLEREVSDERNKWRRILMILVFEEISNGFE